MSEYTFDTLSPIDFEHLVRDLLQSELSIRLETFKAGRDGGIDLRYAQDDGLTLIVQAKHYVKTGFNKLLSDLKSKEKKKIERLQPDRYLLVTSVPLSPANKDKIREALSPFVKSTADIYGKDDLNNLLDLFPEVERNHVKLWLSSTTVLEEVFHSRIINQTRNMLEDIRDKARLYVANESFNKALDILKDHNYVVIAGIPGIGKTTLAKMLVLHYLQSDFEFVEVSHDISDANIIPDHHCPRVYLYDDFLGRTSLVEKLRKKEDHRLVNFISTIRRKSSTKLILTTREYILRQAQGTYEVLNGPIFEKPQCIVDLSQYTRPIRAQILYNHLYFSGLPSGYVEEIVKQATYLKIIDHLNYNPRIVESMTDRIRVECDGPAQYPTIFMQVLKDPFLIWEQAFSKQLTDTAREMLLVLGTLPDEVAVEDLEQATCQYVSRHGKEVSANELRRALSELQGNFVVLEQDYLGDDTVSFHSPSVQDFVDSHLEKNPTLYGALAKTAYFFEQIQWLCQREMGKETLSQIEEVLLTSIKRTLTARPCVPTPYSGRVARLSFVASLLNKRKFAFLEDMFKEALEDLMAQIQDLKPQNESLFSLVEEVITMDSLADLQADFLNTAKASFYENAPWISDMVPLTNFLELCPEMRSSEDNDRIMAIIDDNVDNRLDENDPDCLNDDLDSLRVIEASCGLDLETQREVIRELLENCPQEGDYDDGEYRGSSDQSGSIGNDALADMFSTLLP